MGQTFGWRLSSVVGEYPHTLVALGELDRNRDRFDLRRKLSRALVGHNEPSSTQKNKRLQFFKKFWPNRLRAFIEGVDDKDRAQSTGSDIFDQLPDAYLSKWGGGLLQEV